MQIVQSSISEFMTGGGLVSGTPQPLGHARKLYKGVHVQADLGNGPSVFVYVGPSNVNVANGYQLPAGGSVLIEVDDLGKVYVVGDGGVGNEVQTIECATALAGDMYRLTFEGESTAWMLVGTQAADVQTALEALTAIGAGNVVVGGAADLLAGPLTVTFQGDLADTNVAMIVAEAGTNEQQTIAIDDASNGGTFTLSLGGDTTAAINHNADAAAVQAALEAALGAGNVSVSGGPGPGVDWVVTFQGDLSAQDVDMLVGDGSLLTGGSTDVTVTETTPGVSKPVTVDETQAPVISAAYSWLAQ